MDAKYALAQELADHLDDLVESGAPVFDSDLQVDMVTDAYEPVVFVPSYEFMVQINGDRYLVNVSQYFGSEK